MKEFVSPRQVARAIGVSESSLKRWCDRGLLPTVRTAGGHRRLRVGAVVEFLRQSGQKLAQPELLGLPPAAGTGNLGFQRARQLFRDGLEAGREEECRRLIFDLYLGGRLIRDICDQVIAGAFHDIGDDWQCGNIDVFQERRACGVALRLLHELRSAIPPAAADAPLAIGGTLAGDQYQLPTQMVELTLREAGWKADSLGSNLPVDSVIAGLQQLQPRLCWVSVSHIVRLEEFVAAFEHLYAATRELKMHLMVGGRALTPEVRGQLRYSAYCDNLQHVAAFAEAASASLGAPPTLQ